MRDPRPALPIMWDLDNGSMQIDPRTGERYAEYEMVYTPYDVGRMRAGYCCINTGCGEAQEQAFPEKCSVCGFPMKEKQSQMFAEQFGGDAVGWGAAKSLAELRAEDEEAKERARRRREKPTSRIAIPSWVKSV